MDVYITDALSSGSYTSASTQRYDVAWTSHFNYGMASTVAAESLTLLLGNVPSWLPLYQIDVTPAPQPLSTLCVFENRNVIKETEDTLIYR